MAATVTTPTAIAAPLSAPLAPPDQIISAYQVYAMRIVLNHITAAGITHLVIPPPMYRWSGSTWAPIYVPRA